MGGVVGSWVDVPVEAAERVALLPVAAGMDKEEEFRAEETPLGTAESEDTERVRTRGESVTTVPGTGVVLVEDSCEELKVEVTEVLLTTGDNVGEGDAREVNDDEDVNVAGSACAIGTAETWPTQFSPSSTTTTQNSHVLVVKGRVLRRRRRCRQSCRRGVGPEQASVLSLEREAIILR
jgi:hypothetical protein